MPLSSHKSAHLLTFLKIDRTMATIKTKDAVAAYNVISKAKLTKLEKGTQHKVCRMTMTLKGVAEKFEAFLADTRERLKPEGFDEMVEKARKTERTPEDNKELGSFFGAYEGSVNECVNGELEREIDVEVEHFDVEELCAIAEANELDMATVLAINIG